MKWHFTFLEERMSYGGHYDCLVVDSYGFMGNLFLLLVYIWGIVEMFLEKFTMRKRMTWCKLAVDWKYASFLGTFLMDVFLDYF